MKLLFAILTATVLAVSGSFPAVAAEPGELIAVPVIEAAPNTSKAKSVKNHKKAKKAVKKNKKTKKAVKKSQKPRA